MVLNQHIFRVIFDEETLNKEFFRLAINQKLDELIGKAHGGVGLRHVTKGRFEETEIVLPPYEKQGRILAKLDNLFARSKSAREELARIPRLAERYKQAILAAAFSGELTRDWRARNPTTDEPCVPAGQIDGRVSVLPALPEKWLWASIASVASVTGGLTKNAQRRSLETKTRYLRVANVYANELRLDDVGEIGCTRSELERTRLMPGDLLVVEGNGSPEQIGRVAIWNAEVPECSHQNHLIRVRPGVLTIPKFLLYWVLSPECRSAIERVASSSSGLYTLSISKVSGLPIPLCGVAEQEVIVLRIAEAFTRIDALFGEASRAASLLDRLDQATLAKAFRGELVH